MQRGLRTPNRSKKGEYFDDRIISINRIRLGVGGINSVAGDHFGARELQANFKAVTKKKGILLFLREGTRGSYSLEKYWGPCNLAESCRVRGRALCIFKAVTKKKGILLFLREGNRCSYSLEKCWGPCNVAESCRESCSTRLARLIPPTPNLTMGTPTFSKLKYVESYLRFQYLDILN